MDGKLGVNSNDIEPRSKALCPACLCLNYFKCKNEFNTYITLHQNDKQNKCKINLENHILGLG